VQCARGGEGSLFTPSPAEAPDQGAGLQLGLVLSSWPALHASLQIFFSLEPFQTRFAVPVGVRVRLGGCTMQAAVQSL
jgi:hypothetical protein